MKKKRIECNSRMLSPIENSQNVQFDAISLQNGPPNTHRSVKSKNETQNKYIPWQSGHV